MPGFFGFAKLVGAHFKTGFLGFAIGRAHGRSMQTVEPMGRNCGRVLWPFL